MAVKTEFSNKIFICTCDCQTIYMKDPAYDQCSDRDSLFRACVSNAASKALLTCCVQ